MPGDVMRLAEGQLHFDIIKFSFRFNERTDREIVETGLIRLASLLPLNQRVEGSSPSAPTTKYQSHIKGINRVPVCSFRPREARGARHFGKEAAGVA
jgi:hypothetical protein